MKSGNWKASASIVKVKRGFSQLIQVEYLQFYTSIRFIDLFTPKGSFENGSRLVANVVVVIVAMLFVVVAVITQLVVDHWWWRDLKRCCCCCCYGSDDGAPGLVSNEHRSICCVQFSRTSTWLIPKVFAIDSFSSSCLVGSSVATPIIISFTALFWCGKNAYDLWGVFTIQPFPIPVFFLCLF